MVTELFQPGKIISPRANDHSPGEIIFLDIPASEPGNFFREAITDR
jgi:hypothetical protein